MLHPFCILSMIVLGLNDHIWKAAYGNVWTGKISDVAGLIFFPILLEYLVPSPGEPQYCVQDWCSPYSIQTRSVTNCGQVHFSSSMIVLVERVWHTLRWMSRICMPYSPCPFRCTSFQQRSLSEHSKDIRGNCDCQWLCIVHRNVRDTGVRKSWSQCHPYQRITTNGSIGYQCPLGFGVSAMQQFHLTNMRATTHTVHIAVRGVSYTDTGLDTGLDGRMGRPRYIEPRRHNTFQSLCGCLFY